MLEKAQYAEYILNIFLRKMLAFIDSVHVTPGVFSVYRKRVLLEVGGFDEKNLTEDMDIALRIHDAGYSIENNLRAIAYTSCPDRLVELYKQRLRWYRGAVQNAVKYKHMLFNRRYGNLGLFFLPFNLIAIVAIVFIFFLLALDVASNMLSYAWRFGLVQWDFVTMIPKELSFDTALTYMLNTPLLLWVAGTTMALSLLVLSFRMAGEKISLRRFSYFLYVFIFPFIYMFFWASAMVHELAGRKRHW
ncbi:MAG: glycosyltransferase [Candidatus Aenigmarchaeota archaeon]|nr:glycosyltransferase [Candidatus Aenigmarchaeota archaeon]